MSARGGTSPEVCHADGNEASQNCLRGSWPLDGSVTDQADFIVSAHGARKTHP
jgi:hypothetical protein